MTPHTDAMSTTADRFRMVTRSATAGVVSRPRLLALLDQDASSPITLVLAPAGYGKSTLVAQWADQCDRPIAWVSLSAEANALSTFLESIAEAVDAVSVHPGTGDRSSITSLLDHLHETVASGHRLTIVLDDYHCIENQDVHDAMAGFTAQMPDGVGIIIVSRMQPPLALSRLRANGRITDLTQQDLTFTEAEVASVMHLVTPGRLTAEDIRDLCSRTEGWIAGIHLALASLDRVDTGSTRSLLDSWIVQTWLDDFMVEEVLNQLPSDVRDFVLRTAFLTRLEPALCDAVLDSDQSTALIDTIRRRLVFVRPDGPVTDAVVYHGLFAESVNRIAERELGRAELQQLRRRTAVWFERHGQFDAAVDHAVAAEDWETAVSCLRPLCRDLMDRDAHHSRLYWLQKLPEALILADPHLARWYLSALLYTGQHRNALVVGETMAPMWSESDDPVQRGYWASFQAFVDVVNGQAGTMLTRAYEALRHYPLDCHVERMHAWSAVSGYEFALGNDDAAEQAFIQASTCRQFLPPEQWWWVLQVEPDRANQRALRGDLTTAETMYRLMLERLPTIYRSHEAKIRYRLAAIYLEWNDLHRAREEVACVERDLSMLRRLVWHPEALLVVARVYHAMGERAARDDAMQRARAMCEAGGGQKGTDLLETLQASIWLEEGMIGLVQDWARTGQHVQHAHLVTFGDPDAHLVLIRLDLATGNVAGAEERLRTLIELATSAKRWAELVPLLMWQAVARHRLGDESGAVTSLKDAVRHGERGGFLRSVLTPGHDPGPLLDRARSQLTKGEIAYLQRMPWPRPGAGSRRQAKADGHASKRPGGTLSTRELEVLALLEQGYTNAQIASHLFVSMGTVKKHISSVLRKLGVSNRTAAVQWMRQDRQSSAEGLRET